MTKVTEHTPGPWKQGEKHPCRVIANRIVAYCCDPQDEGTETVEEKANARLIAAAPDLEAACEAAEQCIADFIDVYKRGCSMLVFDEAVKSLRDDALRKVQQALAKSGRAA